MRLSRWITAVSTTGALWAATLMPPASAPAADTAPGISVDLALSLPAFPLASVRGRSLSKNQRSRCPSDGALDEGLRSGELLVENVAGLTLTLTATERTVLELLGARVRKLSTAPLAATDPRGVLSPTPRVSLALRCSDRHQVSTEEVREAVRQSPGAALGVGRTVTDLRAQLGELFTDLRYTVDSADPLPPTLTLDESQPVSASFDLIVYGVSSSLLDAVPSMDSLVVELDLRVRSLDPPQTVSSRTLRTPPVRVLRMLRAGSVS